MIIEIESLKIRSSTNGATVLPPLVGMMSLSMRYQPGDPHWLTIGYFYSSEHFFPRFSVHCDKLV